MSDKQEQDNIKNEENSYETLESAQNKTGQDQLSESAQENAQADSSVLDDSKVTSESKTEEASQEEAFHEETEEELKARLKREKNDRVRKNLRILGLVVACYYFLSAGIDYYQQKKAEGLMLNQEASDVFEKAEYIKSTLSSSLALFSDKGLAFASYSADGAAVTNDGLAKVVNDTAQGKVLSSTFTASFDKVLSSESTALFYAFLGSIENTSDTSALKQMAKRLGCDDSLSEMNFKDGLWTTSKAQYSMTVTGSDHQKTMSLKAEPLNNMPTN